MDLAWAGGRAPFSVINPGVVKRVNIFSLFTPNQDFAKLQMGASFEN
jgi:hypothetical protein